MGGPLEGVRVVEHAQGIAASTAGMLLADLGADVVKVEREGGGTSGPARAVLDRGKRSVTPGNGEARLAQLVAGADVAIRTAVDPLPGTGVALVDLVLPAWLPGPAPWAGDAESGPLVAAMIGSAIRQASFDDVPVDSVEPHVLYAQGAWAAACALAALVEREASGFGQTVTVGGAHGGMVTAAAALVIDPDAPDRHRTGGAGGSVPFYRTYKCADGAWLFLAALTPNFYLPAFEVLGIKDVLDDPRLGGRPGSMLKPENIGWVIDRMAAVFATRGRDEWLALLDEAGIPAGPLLQRDDWLDHPQVQALGLRVEVDDPELGAVVMPGVSLQFTRTPADVPHRAPAPGEHDGDLPVWPVRPLPASDVPARSGPLEGVRVLDLGAIIAGPYAGSLLAELGADVVKVEPLGGESFRGPNMVGYNKGQRGLAIDLQREEGRDAFYRLVAAADVVIDNYRPGVLGRLGLTYEKLAAVNPRVITVSITGFGDGGPLGDKPGFDPVLQAMSGMMTAQGGDDEPVFFTVPVNDVGTAALSALAACAALVERTRSGRGQRVWTSLAGTSCFMQSMELVRYDGRPPAIRGGRDFAGPSPLDRFFATADGWVRVDADSAESRGALDAAGIAPTGVPEAEAGRRLSGVLADLPTGDALLRLRLAGVPAAPARRPRDLVDDEDVLTREVLHRVEHGHQTRYLAGRFARFSRTERGGVLLPPGLGEHSRELLGEAGLDVGEIDALFEAGVVGEGLRFSFDPVR